MMDDRKCAVLLSIQQALLGEVSSRLRAVLVDYSDINIHFDCYYDGIIEDEDREAMSCVETELIASFSEEQEITHSVHRADYPEPIPKTLTWVFFRKEE